VLANPSLAATETAKMKNSPNNKQTPHACVSAGVLPTALVGGAFPPFRAEAQPCGVAILNPNKMSETVTTEAPASMALSFEPIPKNRCAVVVHSAGAYCASALAERLRAIGFRGVELKAASITIKRTGVISGVINKLGNLLP
jgi:hypothetical protein